MSELKIDEHHISELTRDVALLMKDMVHDMDILDDKEQDIFKRYMALVRLGAMFHGAKSQLHMARHLFRMGFDMHHPIFQTKEAIENGWNKINIEDNPMFLQEKKELNINMGELPEELKEAIIEAINHKFGQRESKVH